METIQLLWSIEIVRAAVALFGVWLFVAAVLLIDRWQEARR